MATKLGDITVASGGSWSSGPHTLTAGARTVTLRRKSDGVILATRSFTVEASGAATTMSDSFTGANGSAPNATNWPSVVSEYTEEFSATIQGNALSVGAAGSYDWGEEISLRGGGTVRSLTLSRGGVSRTVAVSVPSRSGLGAGTVAIHVDDNNWVQLVTQGPNSGYVLSRIGGVESTSATVPGLPTNGQNVIVLAANGDITCTVGGTTIGTRSAPAWGDSYSVRLGFSKYDEGWSWVVFDDFSVT